MALRHVRLGPAARLAVIGVLALASVGGVALARTDSATDRAIDRIMSKPQYSQANWGMLEIDPRTGRAVRSLRPKKAFVPGSLAKLFVVSAAWNTLGPGHRFVRPLYALASDRARCSTATSCSRPREI